MSEMRELPPATELAGTAEQVLEAVNGGEDLQVAVAEVAEGLMARVEDGGARLEEFGQVLSESLDHFAEALGGFGESITAFVEGAREALGQGLEWLREHPETFEAAMKLCVLVAFGIEHPEVVADYLEKNPGALKEIIESLAPLREVVK